MPQAVSQSMYR